MLLIFIYPVININITSYPRVVPSHHTLTPYLHVIPSCHNLMSYPHVIPSYRTLMSYPHTVPSRRTFMSYPHVIPSCHTLIPYPHAVPSCHTLMSYPHVIPSYRTLTPYLHVIPSCHTLIPYPHAVPSCHTLMSYPHTVPSRRWSYDFAFPRRSMSTSSRWRKEPLLRLYSLGPKARLERRPPTLTGVFLWSGHLPTLVVRMLLMRAGDVEVNPGPGLFCKPCGRMLRTNQPHLRCGSCIATSHKQDKCSGLRRVSQTPGNWTCSDCVPPRSCTPPLPSTVPTLVGQPIGASRLSGTSAPKKRCLQCGKVVRY